MSIRLPNGGLPSPTVNLLVDNGAGSETPRLGPREWNALIGIVTAIIGNILISFALNIQRYAHIRLERDELRRSRSWKSIHKQKHGHNDGVRSEQAEDGDHTGRGHVADGVANGRSRLIDEASPSRKRSSSRASQDHGDEKMDTEHGTSYLRSPLWWLGITLMTVGEAGNFLAYGFAPASIVSPLGVVALISNCIIAPCLLRERFRQQDFWGVLIAIGGVVTVVLSAKNSEDRMGPHAIWHAITRWEFQLYMGLTVGAMVLLMWLSPKYGDRTVLIDLGLVALFGELSSVLHRAPLTICLGGYTALSTKGVASLLSGTLWRALTFPISYLLAFVLVATALLQIRYLNKALQRFNSTQVIPTQFVLFTISVIVGSAVLYRDFESATGARVGKFVGGCALTFLGVYFITSGRGDEDTLELDDASDAEEGIHLVEEDREAGKPDGQQPRSVGRPSNERDSLRTPQGQRASLASRRSSNYGTLGRLDERQASGSRPQSPHNGDAGPEESEGSAAMTPTKPPFSKSITTPGPIGPAALKTRQSVSRLVPGPLSSPLSSPLSGIVVDRLRKGLNSPLRARHGRLSGLRRWRSDRGEDGDDADEDALDPTRPVIGSSLRSQVDAADQSARPSTGGRRTRSVSDALGNLFRIHRSQGGGDRENDG